jgi:hypothetical protein
MQYMVVETRWSGSLARAPVGDMLRRALFLVASLDAASSS